MCIPPIIINNCVNSSQLVTPTCSHIFYQKNDTYCFKKKLEPKNICQKLGNSFKNRNDFSNRLSIQCTLCNLSYTVNTECLHKKNEHINFIINVIS